MAIRFLALSWDDEINPNIEEILNCLSGVKILPMQNPKVSRATRVAMGYCTRCAINMPIDGFKTCEVCREADKKRENKDKLAKIALDICTRCGGELEPDDGKRCKKCKEYVRLHSKKYREEMDSV